MDIITKMYLVGARRRPLREDLIRDLIERIDLASTAAVILERRGMNFLGNPQTCCDDYKSTCTSLHSC